MSLSFGAFSKKLVTGVLWRKGIAAWQGLWRVLRSWLRNPAFWLGVGIWIATVLAIWWPERRFPTRYWAFYSYQAQAFLQGEVALPLPEDFHHDMITIGKDRFLALPPLNGFLSMPFVVVGGLHFPETVFALALYAFVLVALWCFVDRFGEGLRRREKLLYFLLFAVGTDLWTCAVNGTPWFNTALTSTGFVLMGLALLQEGVFPKVGSRALEVEQTGRSRLEQDLTGLLCLTLASMSRLNLSVLLVGITLWLGWVRYRQCSKVWLWLALPTVWALAFFGWWNWIRFGVVLQLGYEQHAYGAFFADAVHRYGFRHWVYLLEHWKYGFWGLFEWKKVFPFFNSDPAGNGFLVTCPIFILALWGWFRTSNWVRSLVAVGLICIWPVLLTHFSTGWSQFGYRYFLDFFPFLALLLLRLPLSRFSFREGIPAPLFAVVLLYTFWIRILGTLQYVGVIKG